MRAERDRGTCPGARSLRQLEASFMCTVREIRLVRALVTEFRSPKCVRDVFAWLR